MNLEKRIPAGEILTDDQLEMAAGGYSYAECYDHPDLLYQAPYTEGKCAKCGKTGRIPTLSWNNKADSKMCINCIEVTLF